MNRRRVSVVSCLVLTFGLMMSACGSPQNAQPLESETSPHLQPVESVATPSFQQVEAYDSPSLRQISSDEVSVADLADSSEDKKLVELVETWQYVTGEPCVLEEREYEPTFGSTGVECDYETLISVYDTTTDLRRQLKEAGEALRMIEHPGHRLAGANWSMSLDDDLFADPEIMAEFHKELGGHTNRHGLLTTPI